MLAAFRPNLTQVKEIFSPETYPRRIFGVNSGGSLCGNSTELQLPRREAVRDRNGGVEIGRAHV